MYNSWRLPKLNIDDWKRIGGYDMIPDFVLLKIRGIKILPFISLPFDYLDCEPKGIIYRSLF
jgi:hypothetical protein